MLTTALIASVIGGLLNIILAYALSPLATSDEQKPPRGASALSFKGQIMHMLVHHKQVILVSTLIVMLLVFLSCLLAHVLADRVLSTKK